MVLDSVIEKIRKLFAHSESAGELGNQAEAEAFAAKALSLMIQHKIDAAVLTVTADAPEERVDTQDLDTTETFGTVRLAGWRGVLIQGLATAHFCRVIKTGKSKLVLVGAPSDRAVVMFLLEQLHRIAPAMSVEAIPESMVYGRTARMDRNAWLLGFAVGISKKLKEARATAERNPHALVVLNAAQGRTDNAFALAFPKTRTGAKPQIRGSHEAYAAGKAAGAAHEVLRGLNGNRNAANYVARGGALQLNA